MRSEPRARRSSACRSKSLLAVLLVVVNEAGGLRAACQRIKAVEENETYRRVVALDVLGRLELREDVLREDFAELDTHLVCMVYQHSLQCF